MYGDLRKFEEALKADGWTIDPVTRALVKGGWLIDEDTSSWYELMTKDNPSLKVFDIHVPSEYELGWTVNLVEHLCQMEDERQRLRAILAAIRHCPENGRQLAIDGLKECYHRWLLDEKVPEGTNGRVFCPICGALKTR
jgi:hypothetical protein